MGRAASDLPKQYARLGGRPLLALSVNAFARHPRIGGILVVIHAEDAALYEATITDAHGNRGATDKLLPPVVGGASRQDSVRAGLEALTPGDWDGVLIHDAARPFIETEMIDRLVTSLASNDGVIPSLPVADSLKRVAPTGRITGAVDRDGLWRAQTPQAFRMAPILAAHRAAAVANRHDFTDDAALANWHGIDVTIVAGSERNRKITSAEDLALAESTLSPSYPDVRTGSGFDVHRFAPGDHVWLGGIRIPHIARLDGHSDADVVLHALTDALLGAIGDGDIGQHFPPTEARWKGAASRLFLEDAARRVRERGGRIGNADITILCEAPKIGPHRETMRAAIADILGIEVSRVGVKATTTEGLGFTGRREGIAAMATATIILPGI
jgi:2-C-methyl-D-erythritol 4-phosphate cytidylyltransferase/2-C-methyl-D-erythritol 2,4-cyclodiphosphate synthase